MNNLLSLQKLFNETLFRIPDYQRGYSWSNQQLEEFWSDLTSLLPFQEHYTGMISLKKLESTSIINSTDKWNEEKWLVGSGYTVYEIVDGQQRLTTLIILINEIVSYCKENNIEELNNTLLSEIVEKYLYKSKSNNIIRTYKFGYEEDNPSYQYFRHVILGEPNNGTIEETFYTLNLYNAKNFFKNKIDKYGPLLAFLCWLPFIGDVFAIGLGFYRLNFVKCITFIFLGKAARFGIWVVLFIMYGQSFIDFIFRNNF